MYSLFKQFLTEWNSGKNQRTKLQQAYLFVVVALAVAAGFLSLINNSFGRTVMMIAAGIVAVYVVNGAAWALLDALVVPKLPKNDKPARKK